MAELVNALRGAADRIASFNATVSASAMEATVEQEGVMVRLRWLSERNEPFSSEMLVQWDTIVQANFDVLGHAIDDVTEQYGKEVADVRP